MVALWTTLERAAAAGEWVALATVVGVNGSAPRASGARMVVWPDGRSEGTVGGGNFEQTVVEAALSALQAREPRRLAVHLTRDLGMCCGGAMEVFIEPIRPHDRLVIFGAGHVAVPTAAFAGRTGWQVVVVDERDELNTEDRFPAAERVTTDPRRYARSLQPDGRTWIFVVTHDHALDQDLIETLIPHQWVWLGLIGSRAKVTKFHLRLRAAGVPPEALARIHGPVGLDIGAETPEEIAISVLAEMVRVRRGSSRPAAPLRIG